MQPPPSTYTVSVRALCAFAAKCGDLDHRFTPSPSAAEGIAGHRVIASKRAPAHRSEVAVRGSHRHLVVRGRADGFDADRARVEEVKTFKGDLDRMPANHRELHWAQAKVYACLLCEAHELPAMSVALVYFDVVRQEEAEPLVRRIDAVALRAFFEALCERFIAWADRELAHRTARDAELDALVFPHATFRRGQRDFSKAVFNAARSGRLLVAEAPTGIGKTIASLFPMLKAMPRAHIDKLLFLTAKGSGARLAFDALSSLSLVPRDEACGESGDPPSRIVELVARDEACHESGDPPSRNVELVARDEACDESGAPPSRIVELVPRDEACDESGDPPSRIVELVARDKACEHPELQCHGESCPLARGFYDRLPAARSEAASTPMSTGIALRDIARRHEVCPYWLGQEMARWADVIVADYHYWFDASGSLYAAAVDESWRVVALVDEAHNLVDRAREMYGATLQSSSLNAARHLAPPALAPAIERLHRAWGRIAQAQESVHRIHERIPRPLLAALEDMTSTIGASLDDGGLALDTEVRRFHFDALHFLRMAETFDTHSIFDVTLELPSGMREKRHRSSTLAIRNLLPAPFLAPRFAALHAGALFSATLTPHRYYADTLGLPASAARIDVDAPFRAEQLAVHVVRQVSTRYAHRLRSLAPIASLIADRFAAAPGNYLAFFSSHEYMLQAADRFATTHAAIPSWTQDRSMSVEEREAFLARFTPHGAGIGFAVLGGSFAEGIDLVGPRLVGAFIATLGLPQVNPVNEEMRRRLDDRFGAGFDYAYLYPGLRKVVQAAGRVIRTPDDRGAVYLIDDRFARDDVRALLPRWWKVQSWSPRRDAATPHDHGAPSAQRGGATDAPSMR